jgi:hypothetical protein
MFNLNELLNLNKKTTFWGWTTLLMFSLTIILPLVTAWSVPDFWPYLYASCVFLTIGFLTMFMFIYEANKAYKELDSETYNVDDIDMPIV